MHHSFIKAIGNLFGQRISPTSLQFRLSVESIAIAIVSLSCVSLWAGWRMEQTLITTNKQLLEYIATRFPEQVEMYMETGGLAAGIERTTKKVATSGLAILVQSPDGRLLGKSANNDSAPDNAQIIEAIAVPTTPQIIQFRGRSIVLCGNALMINSKLVGKVYLSKDVTTEQNDLNQSIYGLAIVSILATAIAILAIVHRVRKTLDPLAQISHIASVVSIEDLKSSSLQLDRAPDEIQGLVRAFNQMLLRLSATWEQQRQFVGNVSHELRTPLTTIGGYLQSLLLRGDNLSTYQQQAIATASSETTRTIQMLQDLLDLARADSGNLHFRQSPVFLNTLLVEVAAMSENVSGRSVKLIPPDCDVVALADQDRLQQVLINLVDNAIKYSADAVEIKLETRDNLAIVQVCDRGIGISLEHQSRIFERFYRADGAETRSRDGTGLGLAIAKSLIESMNDKITVRSKPDLGSTFTISLPVWKSQP